MGRGLYGQSEGNETRPAADSLSERIQDNQVAEGEQINVVKRMIRQRAWNALEQYRQQQISKGFSSGRFDTVVRVAMAGMRF